jgi:hypothetical protein
LDNIDEPGFVGNSWLDNVEVDDEIGVIFGCFCFAFRSQIGDIFFLFLSSGSTGEGVLQLRSFILISEIHKAFLFNVNFLQ